MHRCGPDVITGRPDPAHISTSYVEKTELERSHPHAPHTRLSNGFSRKIENHAAAVAINGFAYNFIKIHRTLRVSPAMAAGVTSRLCDVFDLVALFIESESNSRLAGEGGVLCSAGTNVDISIICAR